MYSYIHVIKKGCCTDIEALLGVMVNREIMSFISWKHKSKYERSMGLNAILGSREHRKLRF